MITLGASNPFISLISQLLQSWWSAKSDNLILAWFHPTKMLLIVNSQFATIISAAGIRKTTSTVASYALNKVCLGLNIVFTFVSVL
jgi:hypothetical protein